MTPSTRESESAASIGAPAAVIAGATLQARIGEGALSEVFRATQPSLERSVAIKILKRSIAPGSQLGRRFLREAALLARLHHQHIPQVFDRGELDGRPYLVLEYVDGVSLQTLLKRAIALPPDCCAVIALGIARALEHLHQHDIVHRDLKPANLLLGRKGDIKVTDLGVARDLREEKDGLGVVGTPAYMSPEQVLGDHVDPRSDLFSFGIVFYEMLTGRRPFEEATGRSVMQKIRLDRYTPARTLRREVPATLDRILARCLEKNPAHRYQSTALLVRELEQFLTDQELVDPGALLADLLQESEEAPRRTARKAAPKPIATKTSKKRTWFFVILQGFFGVCSVVALVGGEVLRRREGATGPIVTPGPRPLGTEDVGFLRVVAHPWGTIFLDGIEVETTPTAQAFRLAPGPHRVRLENPSFPGQERTVRIQRGATLWLDVDLQQGATQRTAPAEVRR